MPGIQTERLQVFAEDEVFLKCSQDNTIHGVLIPMGLYVYYL